MAINPFDLGIATIDDPWGPKPMPRFESGPIALRGMRFDLLHCQWDSFGITVRVSVPDRDTDAPIEINFRSQWPEPPRSPEHMATMLEAGIAWMVAHEMAERMLVYGRRRDPHARAEGPPPRGLRFPLQLDPALGMQPFGSHEPLDEIAILTRAEVDRYLLESGNFTRDDLQRMPDSEARAAARCQRRAASTLP